MEIKVKNIQGSETGQTVTLSDKVFGIEPNQHAIYLDVKQYLAAQRQGTHCTKHRGVVSGSTVKLKRQKGTGTARAGSVKSGTRVGGGRMFGPEPRSYDFKLNKKLKQLARRSVLSQKAQNSAITVVDELKLANPKTKEFISMTENLALAGKRILVVIAENDLNIQLASRNVPRVKVANVSSLNTYDLMNCTDILMGVSAVEAINELFA